MIFLPRKKIVVDCFTSSINAFELFPIDHAIKFVPDWWRNMPKEYEVRNLFPASTLKRCPAVIETYKHGMILPLWSDLAIRTDGGHDWEIKFSDIKSNIEVHDARQWSAYADADKFTQYKLMSPWAVKTKEDIMWSFSKATWNFNPDNPLHILNGVIGFQTQHSTHINIIMPLDQAPSRVIQAGQPMIHMLPLTEKEIVIKKHLISEDEYALKHTGRFTYAFTKGFKKAMAIKKEKKCPFNFKKVN